MLIYISDFISISDFQIVKRSQSDMQQVEWQTMQNARFDFTQDLHEGSRRKENMVALGCLKLANLVTAARADASRRHF